MGVQSSIISGYILVLGESGCPKWDHCSVCVGLGETRCPKWDYHRGPYSFGRKWVSKIHYCSIYTDLGREWGAKVRLPQGQYWFERELRVQSGITIVSVLVWGRSDVRSRITTGVHIGYGEIGS